MTHLAVALVGWRAPVWHKNEFPIIIRLMPSQLILWVQLRIATLLSGRLQPALAWNRFAAALTLAGRPLRQNAARSQFSTEGPGLQRARFWALSPTAGGNLAIRVSGVQKRPGKFDINHLAVDRDAVFCGSTALGEPAYRT